MNLFICTVSQFLLVTQLEKMFKTVGWVLYGLQLVLFFHCLKTFIYFSKILIKLKMIWVAITDSFRIPQNGCQIFWEKYSPLQYPLHTLSKVSLMYSSVFFVCFMKNKINTGEQGVTSLLWTFSAIQVHRHWGLPTAKTNPIINSCILILSFMLISNIASFMWNQIS